MSELADKINELPDVKYTVERDPVDYYCSVRIYRNGVLFANTVGDGSMRFHSEESQLALLSEVQTLLTLAASHRELEERAWDAYGLVQGVLNHSKGDLGCTHCVERLEEAVSILKKIRGE